MFKVRAKRGENGTYDLSYGKGSKKLSAILVNDSDENLPWAFTPRGTGIRYQTKRDAILAWESGAKSEYGGTSSVEATTQNDGCDRRTAAVSDSAPAGGDDWTWAQAFARVANHPKPLTASQRHDLKLLLNRLLADEVKPTPAIPPPPVVKFPPPPAFKPAVKPAIAVAAPAVASVSQIANASQDGFKAHAIGLPVIAG